MALSMIETTVNSEALECSINGYKFEISMYSAEFDEELGLMRLALVTINPTVGDILNKIYAAILQYPQTDIIIYNGNSKISEMKNCKIEYMNMSKEEVSSFSATFLYEKI